MNKQRTIFEVQALPPMGKVVIMNGTSLDLLMSPSEFFRGKITEASRHLNIELEDHVEFYLVNLLTSFVAPASSSQDSEASDDLLSTPLAFLLKKAIEAPSEKQPHLYRRLGDTSLYVSGFFQDFFNKKIFDITYYINMGASAYEQASVLCKGQTRDDGLQTTLTTISKNFNQIVDVVAQASDSTALRQDKDLLAIYDRWNRSGSPRLREILEERGIRPVRVPFKQAH